MGAQADSPKETQITVARQDGSYVCSYCQASFRRGEHLKRHISSRRPPNRQSSSVGIDKAQILVRRSTDVHAVYTLQGSLFPHFFGLRALVFAAATDY